MNLRSLLSAAMPVMMAFGLLCVSTAYAAEPQPWQLGLQDPAGSIEEIATSLHNMLVVIFTAISLVVVGLLVYVCVRFRASANPKP